MQWATVVCAGNYGSSASDLTAAPKHAVLPINREHRHSFNDPLCGNHAIERIEMLPVQAACAQRVGRAQAQRRQARLVA